MSRLAPRLIPWLACVWLAALPLVAAAAPTKTPEVREPPQDEQPVDLEKLRRDRKQKEAENHVDSRISRYLTAAAEASDKGDPEKGLALLDRLDPKRLNSYERALVDRLRAYISYAAGDYDATIANFEAVLSEEVLPVDAEDRIRFNIAQLYAALQQWQNVITALDRWFHYAEKPTPLAYYLRGLSYYQLGRIDDAITNTQQAIDLSDKPVESWLQLLAALFVQKQDYASATPVLEELLVKFPKKQYWSQLSLIYGARDDYRLSLAVQQVAYLQGFLTEDKELRRLVRSYLYNDLPYPAATILEKEIHAGRIKGDADAWETLANSWIAAREYDKSLAPLQKAAELSPTGKLLVRLGQVHLQREEWAEAAQRFEEALARGGLDDPGQAQILLGIAYYESKRMGPARVAFKKASGYSGVREQAERWLEHIEKEASES